MNMISKMNFYFALLKKLVQKVKMSWKKFQQFLIQKAYRRINYAGYAQMVHQLCLVQGRDSRLNSKQNLPR